MMHHEYMYTCMKTMWTLVAFSFKGKKENFEWFVNYIFHDKLTVFKSPQQQRNHIIHRYMFRFIH